MIHLISCLIASFTFMLLAGGIGLFARRTIGVPSSILLGAGLASASTSYLALYLKGSSVINFYCLLIYISGFWSWSRYFYGYFQAKKGASLNLNFLRIFLYLILLASLPLIPLLDSIRVSHESTIDSIKLFEIAQNLYLNLPIDNIISAKLAGSALKDTYTSPLIGDWLGSDRPPLQSGLIILLSSATDKLSFNWDLSSFTASIAANSMWILGALAFASVLTPKRYLIYATLLPVVLSGYVILNTTFTWPKSLAAGFLLASVAIVCKKENYQCKLLRNISAGLLLGFACLSHGSSFFAVPAIIIASLIVNSDKFIISQNFKSSATLIATFAFIQIPWIFWQKAIDPPGDRLLKWHLAGHIPIATDSFIKLLISNYKDIGVSGIFQNKVANFMTLFGENCEITIWKSIISGDYNSALSKEFYFHAPAVLTWILPTALFIFVFLLIKRKGLESIKDLDMKFLSISLFIYIMTIVFWCLAMFGPSTTINHQGTGLLVILPLMLAGAVFASINFSLFVMGCIIQSFGIFAVYTYQSTNQARLAFAICEISIIFTSVWLHNFYLKDTNNYSNIQNSF
jgi:hypothetical protein